MLSLERVRKVRRHINISVTKSLKSLLLKRRWLTIYFAVRARYHYALKNVKKASLILDVGAGPGLLADELRRRGHEVVVSDIDSRQMRGAKSLLKIEAVVLDAAHLCFRDKAFNVVVSLDVYEHLDKHKRSHFIKEMLRVAKEGLSSQ